jgi:hypothetical protein
LEERVYEDIQDMKRTILFFICIFSLITGLTIPCLAQEKTYRVEILQITALEELQSVYDGFINELGRTALSWGRTSQSIAPSLISTSKIQAWRKR